MKRYVFLIILLVVSGVAFAQQRFKYVIIPTTFSDLGKNFNPYNVSSSMQKVLSEKGIKTVFASDTQPADYCDALTVDLEKTSSLFTNKLLVKLKDCQNRVVWSKEGAGRSKDFPVGYAEALADAFEYLPELPVSTLAGAARKQAEPVASAAPAFTGTVSGSEGEVYTPKSLYFNDTYFVDVVDAGEKEKKLIIVNGKLLGYEKLQEIGRMVSTDLEGMFTIEWTTVAGDQLRGIAELKADRLIITLSSGDNPMVITLMKQ